MELETYFLEEEDEMNEKKTLKKRVSNVKDSKITRRIVEGVVVGSIVIAGTILIGKTKNGDNSTNLVNGDDSDDYLKDLRKEEVLEFISNEENDDYAVFKEHSGYSIVKDLH